MHCSIYNLLQSHGQVICSSHTQNIGSINIIVIFTCFSMRPWNGQILSNIACVAFFGTCCNSFVRFSFHHICPCLLWSFPLHWFLPYEFHVISSHPYHTSIAISLSHTVIDFSSTQFFLSTCLCLHCSRTVTFHILQNMHALFLSNLHVSLAFNASILLAYKVTFYT